MVRSRAEGLVIKGRHLAIALFLLCSVPPVACAEEEVRAPDGKALFLYACATCHLGRGSLLGVAPLPLLLSEPLRYGDTAAALGRSIRSGVGSALMPAFEGALTDAEIDALVAYVRSQRARAGAPGAR